MADPVRRALITGASGFIGRQLARTLLNSGWTVSAMVRPSSDTEQLRASIPGDSILVHDGTTGSMIELMSGVRPDTVFHLAALYVFDHRQQHLEDLIASNLLFGTQVLEAMAACDCHRLVNAATSWQNFDGVPGRAANLYAATKQAFEVVVDYYCDAKRVQAISLEFIDTYGPLDSRGKIVERLCEAVAGEGMLDLSPGEQRLALIHVNDIAVAFAVAGMRHAELCGGEQSHLGHAKYSLRPDAEITLRELATQIEALAGKPLSANWGAKPYRHREVMAPSYRSDPLPGWQPRISLTEGLSDILKNIGQQSKKCGNHSDDPGRSELEAR